MGQVDQANAGSESVAHRQEADSAWAESLRDVFRQVIATLPDHATLGELVHAAHSTPSLTPVLRIFTVQELIETAKKKPKPRPAARNGRAHDDEVVFDAEGNPIMDLDSGPAVIRRRADVPDGDVRVLRMLTERGALKEGEIATLTKLTAEQLRIILRQLKTKGHIHIEGSGVKRRIKVTRSGSGYLRKLR
jgi:hypothetical protein